MTAAARYLPIADYALIGDCHSAALISRHGSIDWCCLPRFDSGSAFARLLDADRGGYCSFAPAGRASWQVSRACLEDTLVLRSTFQGSAGEARLLDLFLVCESAHEVWERRLLRVIEVVRGTVEFEIAVAPRFDYGEVRPWLRRDGPRLHSAIGGNDALLVFSQAALEESADHRLSGRVRIAAGERVHLQLAYCPPELVGERAAEPEPAALDRDLEGTIAWWRRWA